MRQRLWIAATLVVLGLAHLPVVSARQAISDSLVSYWPLDEASGNAIDAHGSNDLTDNNTVGAATGKVSGARNFVAANSEFFSIASNSTLQTGDIDFTFAFWINMTTSPINARVFTKGTTSSAGGEYEVPITSPDLLRFQVRAADDASSSFRDKSGALLNATWYFAVVWHDSVNDVLVASIDNISSPTTAHAGGVFTGTNPFRLGATEAPSFFFDGLIDEVGFWKRVLTADERTWLYNAGAGRSYTDIATAPNVFPCIIGGGIRRPGSRCG